MWSVFKRQGFNDTLAILLAVIVFPGMLVLHGFKLITLPDIVMGSILSLETLVVQYYFRRSPQNGNGGAPVVHEVKPSAIP